MKRTDFRNVKRALSIVFSATVFALLTSCSGAPKLKLDIDSAKGTFSFVDISTGKRLSYQKLFINGKEVIDTHCMSGGMFKSVAFAFEKGEIVRNGSSVTFNCKIAFTEHAELKYKLENGTLTLFKN